MNFFSNNNKKPVFIFSAAVFVLMPFVYSGYFQDVEQSMRFVFLSIVLFVTSVYLFFQLKHKNASQQFSFFNQNIFISIAGYILISVFSMGSSVNKGEALFEVLKLCLFFSFLICCFFILIKTENKAEEIFIKAVNISVLIFTCMALVQLYPLVTDYFKNGKPVLINYALSSGLGNKNFYAETIFLSLPFVLNGVVIFKKTWKLICIFNSVIIIITLIVLQTLSTWTAFIVGGFVMVLLLFLFKEQFFSGKSFLKNKKIIAGSIMVLLLSLFIASALYMRTDNFKQLKQRIATAQKYFSSPESIADTSVVNNNSTYERMILWKNSVKMIKEHPVFGNGMSNWKIYFPKYGIGKAPYMNVGTTKFTRSHNDFLFISAETGIAGLLFYISVFVFLFYYGAKIIRSEISLSQKKSTLLMLSGISGYFVIVFFSLPNDRYYPVLLFMLMISFVLSQHEKIVEAKKTTSSQKSWQGAFFTCSLVCAISFTIGFIRVQSDIHLSKALVAQKKKDWNRMIHEISMINKSYFPLDYTTTPVIWYKGFANFYSGNQRAAFADFKEAEKVNPYHVQVLNDIGTCYNISGNSDKAYEYYQKVLGITPLFQDALLNLSAIYYNAGNIDSAYAVISRYNFKKTTTYRRNLNAILFSKATNVVSQLQDSILKEELNKKLTDEKFLLKIQEEAVKQKITFEEVLLNERN